MLFMKIIVVYSECPGYTKHIHALGKYRFFQSLMDVCVWVCVWECACVCMCVCVCVCGTYNNGCVLQV